MKTNKKLIKLKKKRMTIYVYKMINPNISTFL